MLFKLKKQLIILNTIITSFILSIVIIGACDGIIKQIKKNSLDSFVNLQDTITYRLQSENIINDAWVAELEAAYKLIIHIEDNGLPFFFKGSWISPSLRETMIDEAKKEALLEGIDTTVYSIHSDKVRSSIFNLNSNQTTPVYGSVCLIPNDNGYMSLTLIQYRPNEKLQINRQVILFIGINILGIFALFLVSCFFINKALKPVVDSQKRQTEFIAAASHDLRSPLAVIQTNASALLIDGTDPKRFVPIIIKECTRMSRLIHDMLILASSDSKTWIVQKEVIDTDTYLIDLYDSFSSLCQKKEHNLTIDFLQDTLPQIYADKDHLTQVLSILIDNAISYSPVKSNIILRPYQKKASFFIEVEDHGIGITKEQKEYIFNRFYRADNSRNDNSHFGLGLSVAKELIELQNGKISMKNTVDGGSTFMIELPL